MTDLIIGGTGTLGEALLERLYYDDNGHDAVVFSRDELKQRDLKKKFPRLRTFLGDIRDHDSLARLYDQYNVNRTFHFAALKHVDILETNIEEAVDTNILGLMNSAEAAISAKVPAFYFTSTDKAVLPINVYGMTKGIGERYLLDKNNKQRNTKFFVYRWGNIIGSRGSVIPEFMKTLRENGSVNITHNDMTRFWLKVEDAVDFMLKSYDYPFYGNGVLIPPMQSAKVRDIILACNNLTTKTDGVKTNTIGMRAGEKIHEAISEENGVATRTSAGKEFYEPEYSIEQLQDMIRECS